MEIDGSCGGYCTAEGCTSYDLLLYSCLTCSRQYCSTHCASHGCLVASTAKGSSELAVPTLPRLVCDACNTTPDSSAIVKCSSCDKFVCLAHRYPTAHHCRVAIHQRAAAHPARSVPSTAGTSRSNRLCINSSGSSACSVSLLTLVNVASGAIQFILANTALSLGSLIEKAQIEDTPSTATYAGCKPSTGDALFIPISSRSLTITALLRTISHQLHDEEIVPELVLVLLAEEGADEPTLMALPLVKKAIADVPRGRRRSVPHSLSATTSTAIEEHQEGTSESALVRPLVMTYDAAFPKLVDVPFVASKLKPMAAKEAGAPSVVVAVYLIQSPSAADPAAKPSVLASCFRVSSRWPIGKLVDVVLECLQSRSNASAIRVFDLRSLCWVEKTSRCDSLRNGSCLLLVLGEALPSCVLQEAQDALVAESSTLKHKIRKDCIIT